MVRAASRVWQQSGAMGVRRYAVGQRLVIKESAVLEFAGLIEQLGSALLKSSPFHCGDS